jgi:hypothetical protein
MFMKKFGVAAALALFAVSASASNFRGADQVYIPAAGHFQGSSGVFISDIYLANLSPDEVSVSVIYQPLGAGGGTGQEFRDAIQLRGYERKELLDFFRNTAAGVNLQGNVFGQLIFNGCKKATSCGPETQDADGVSPNFRNISATSRIYQIANNAPANPPTTGQLFTGIPWYNFVSSLQNNESLDKIFITGITQTGTAGTAGTFRTNIGLINASQYSRTTMVVKAYQGTLTEADKKGEFTVDIGRLGNVQLGFTQMFPNLSGANYFVTVEQRNNIAEADAPQGCVQGCPAFLAYGSVLDNLSGDATTLEAQYLVPLSNDALGVIYPNAGKIGVKRSVRH